MAKIQVRRFVWSVNVVTDPDKLEKTLNELEENGREIVAITQYIGVYTICSVLPKQRS